MLYRSLSRQDAEKAELVYQNMIVGISFGALAVYSAVLTFASGSMLGLTGERLTNRLRMLLFKVGGRPLLIT